VLPSALIGQSRSIGSAAKHEERKRCRDNDEQRQDHQQSDTVRRPPVAFELRPATRDQHEASGDSAQSDERAAAARTGASKSSMLMLLGRDGWMRAIVRQDRIVFRAARDAQARRCRLLVLSGRVTTRGSPRSLVPATIW
jgi:hypothetical protein